MFQPEIESESEAVLFDWHPTEKFLAVGWSDGRKLFLFTSFVSLFGIPQAL
jgi:hypothetical protein